MCWSLKFLIHGTKNPHAKKILPGNEKCWKSILKSANVIKNNQFIIKQFIVQHYLN